MSNQVYSRPEVAFQRRPDSDKLTRVVTVASGTFTDGTCYIEEPNRVAGIKIMGAGVSLGDRVTLIGNMSTDANGERYVAVSSLTTQTSGIPLGALGMNNTAAVSRSVSGLLVKAWGKVTAKSGGNLMVDDGCGVGVIVIITGLTTGITQTINVGNYVTITGVASLLKIGLSTLDVIRPRGSADIVVVE